MNERGGIRMNKRIWMGLFFLFLGLGFFLQQAGVFNFSTILSTWWPLILIFIGIIQLVNRTHSTVVSGFIFIIVGALFLVNEFVAINLAAYIWPIILIVIGLVFIFSKMNHNKNVHSAKDLSTFAFFSGADIRSNSKDFKGGSVGALFGGAEIDLRDVVISENGAALELTTIFGGISIRVPENVYVDVKGVPIFGGWENNTRWKEKDDSDLPVLTINCFTIFGGVEIND